MKHGFTRLVSKNKNGLRIAVRRLVKSLERFFLRTNTIRRVVSKKGLRIAVRPEREPPHKSTQTYTKLFINKKIETSTDLRRCMLHQRLSPL